MIAATWIVAACAVLTIIGVLLRLLWLTSALVERIDGHMADTELHRPARKRRR